MILPPLNDLLQTEQERHHKEVSRITRFHRFLTAFEENEGCIDGVEYRLSAIGDGVARFIPVDRELHSDYFYDAEKENPHPISKCGDDYDSLDYPIAVWIVESDSEV